MPILKKTKKNFLYFSLFSVAMEELYIKNGYRAYSHLYLPYKNRGKDG